MNKYNTVFGQMLEAVSRSEFEKLVKEYKTEYGAKGIKSWTQFTFFNFNRAVKYIVKVIFVFFDDTLKRQGQVMK